jgi:Family of unknown function (DUF5719)/IPT/TIG domain
MFRKTIATALLLTTAILLLATAAPAADDPGPPSSTPKLIFIHHSCGENWLADGNGNLGSALRDNNYFVSDTNYGWGPDGIGNNTDIGHWWTWFRGPQSSTYTDALYTEYGQNCSYSRLGSDPGGENEIIMFKSCYPNSALTGSMSDPVPPIGSNPLAGNSGPLTVANCRGIYNDLLNYFSTRLDKLFVVITAPPMRTLPDGGAPDRAFNNWLVNDWLDSYPYSNVFVFDFYNVLTTNGGNANVNDLNQETGNHHRWWNNAVQHKTDGGSNVLAYPTGDDHPSAAGNQKATAEFVPLLNVAYNRFKASANLPHITSISPTSAHVPATVTLTGSRFGSTRGSSYVSFNGVHASSYSSWSDTSVRCVAPAGTPSGPVTVTTGEGTSNRVLFTVANQTWYLAEGCTGTNSQGSFETWVVVQNPSASSRYIDVIFQTGNGQVHGPQEMVPAESRRSYRANDYVSSFEVSTKVNADGDVVCERAMYGTGGVWAHDSIGTTDPSTTWYLAEGCTRGGFETWVLVQNPNSSPARVTLTYMTESGKAQGPTVDIGANSRETFFAADSVPDRWSVSTQVTSDLPVIAERSVYGNGRTWAHDSIGATATSQDWYLAEGCTAGGFETWVVVQNPNASEAEVQLTYMTPDGATGSSPVTVPAFSRRTFDVSKSVPDAWEVSTRVHADAGVVAERAMYGNGRAWAHDSTGARTPAATWYMAEGCTASGYETWVQVQNPGSTDAEIDVVFQTDSGRVQGPRETLPARTRQTYNVRDYVESYNVSTMVTAISGQVVCERAMYGSGRRWAHDSIGYTP